MHRTHGRRTTSLLLFFLLFATLFVALPGAQAPAQAAWGSYLAPSKNWTVLGVKMIVTGSGYQYNYACGVKDCDKVSNVYAYVGRTGGEAKGNKARIKVGTSFTGAGASVSAGGSLSGPSGSVGVTAYDKSCGTSEWYESRPGKRQVSINTDGTFCKASTYAWLCSVKLTATGAIRIGDNWYAKNASDSEDLGC
ncbi:hypothetical protein JK386_07405 [Nocardioides sp. zg-536]|uniref:Secreted protein n=1 Tax=Nocardioides faecalis TaxID=2803858 RepID=A0A938Y935_9ACTN|nr:hypothetical protein [Nocardioides faecalis]MBM9459726.1 hypothetical protein [Nocardioides faecalis]MBS4753497.1 hypothetical protein [Nocardioides faecalis]QVI58245.1 hypothetical protein KG111_14700 [Nocardioides faecalis]